MPRAEFEPVNPKASVQRPTPYTAWALGSENETYVKNTCILVLEK
jgi:hypothetical protein